MQHDPVVILTRLDELAADIGRLKRLTHGELADWQLDRMAANVESLAVMFEPTAAELVAWYAPGDDVAIEHALRHVDRRAARWRRKLGLEAAT